MDNGFVIGLVDSSVVSPQNIGFIEDWNTDCLRELSESPAGSYTDIVNMVFSQLPEMNVKKCLEITADEGGDKEFRKFLAESQYDLALESLNRLPKIQTECSTLVFSHSSIEQAVFGSNATRLAVAKKWQKAQYYSLSQQCNLSLFHALEIINETFKNENCQDSNAVFCSAEKWVKPYPRKFSHLDSFSDGACSLRISSDPNSPVNLGGLYFETGDTLLTLEKGRPQWNMSMAERVFKSAFKNCIHSLFRNDVSDLKVMISVPSSVLKDRIIRDIKSDVASLKSDRDGYFGSADAALLVHDLITDIKFGRNGNKKQSYLLCAMNPCGNFGAALLSSGKE
ncbi:MAG: hypothetical protein HRU19_07180 [Pseudobacteriovorax sp.]|nr:hypothetical protein [Pseudobacteriovorax sp.]